MTERSHLHEQLVALRAGFGPIQKTGENRGVGGGYRFVEATEIAAKFVELASGLGLTMVAVDGEVLARYKSISEKQWVVDVKMIYRITDSSTGESIDIVGFGQGADNADKALPKAQTNAMKYAIMAGVLQAAGDDPEADANVDRIEQEGRRAPQAPRPQAVAARPVATEPAKPSPAMLKKLMATFDEKDLKDPELRKAFTITVTGKSSSKDLVVADVDKLFVALAAYTPAASSSAE